MRKPDAGYREFPIWKQRLLLAAVLLAFAGMPVRAAEVELSVIRTRADTGDPEAMNALANAYVSGQGVPQNYPEAIRLYQAAADKGIAAASFNLGMLNELGRGTPANPQAAFRYYLKAAQQGFAPAQFNVGNMYANGVGGRQDYVEAAVWFRQAADRAVPEAQYNLALAYELGRGVTKDETTAQRWYRDAANQGYVRARYNLALMLEEGRGAPADPAAAAELYRVAAAQSFAPAQNNLGLLLAEGRGVPQNLVEAYAWLSLAVENGAKATGRDIVARQLTPTQVADAKNLLAAFHTQIAAGTVPAPLPVAAANPGAAAAQPAPDAAALQSEVEKLRTENRLLSVTAENLAQQKAALEQRLTAAEAVKSEAASRDKLAADLAAAEKALAEVRDTANRLGEENARLRVVTDHPSPAESNAAALRAQLDELTRQKQAAEQRAAELEAQLKAAQDGGTGKDSGREKATEQKSPDASKPLKDQQGYLDKLEETNKQLNDRIAALTTERDRLADVAKKASSGPDQPLKSVSETNREHEVAEKIALEKSVADRDRQLADQKEFARKLEEANGRLNNELALLNADREKLAQELKQATTTPAVSAQAQKDVADAIKQRDTAAGEKAALELRVADLNRQVLDQQSKLDALQQTNTRIASELDSTRKERDNLAAISQQNVGAQAKAVTAEKALADAAKLQDILTAEKAVLGNRVNELIGQLATQQAATQKLEQGNANLADRLAVMKAERDRLADLAKKNAASQADSTQAQQAIADLTKARDAIAADKTAIERQVAELGNRLAAQKSLTEKAEQANAELNQRLAAITAERDKLAAAPAETAADRQALDKLNGQLDTANRTIADLNARSDSLEKDLEVAKQSAAAALAAQAAAAKAAPTDAMKLEMQTLQEQVRTLETQLDNERRNSAQEVSALAGQLQAARDSNRALSDANRALMQVKGTDDATTKATVDGLKTDLAAAQSDLEKARAAQAAATADLATRSRELEQAKAETAAIQAKFADATKAADQQGSAVAELTGVNEKLSTDKAALEKQLTQLRQDFDTTKGQLTELKTRVSASDRIAQDQLANINDLTAANDKLQTQVKDLNTQVAALQADNARLTGAATDLTALRAELADTKSKLADAQKAADQQGGTVAELTGANEKLSNDLKEAQAQIAGLRADSTRLAQSEQARRDAEQRAASLTVAAAQLAATQRDLSAARAEIARLNDTIQALDRDRTARVTQLQQENAAINARLKQAQDTLERIASTARLLNSGGTLPVATPAATSASIPVIPITGASAPTAPAARYHLVAEGDSLTRISMRYYGTAGRWQEIYDANRDLLRGENTLRPGQRLRIP